MERGIKDCKRIIFSSLLSALLVLAFSISVHAQDSVRYAETLLPVMPEKISVISGIRIASKALQEIGAEVSTLKDKAVVLVPAFDKNIGTPNKTFYVSLAKLKDGSYVLSSVVDGKTALATRFSKAPICQKVPETSYSLENEEQFYESLATLENIYTLRLEKRKLIRESIKQLIDSIGAERLNLVEKELGLAKNQPLISDELSPYDLVFRLSRMRYILQELGRR